MSNKNDKIVSENDVKEKVDTDIEDTVSVSDDGGETIIIEEKDSLEEANKKIEEYKDIAQRLQAEFDNYRKRNNESIKNAKSEGIYAVIEGLLPVLDNFERGLETITDDVIKSGMGLIYKQLLMILTKYNIEEIKALGEIFDPKYHHAIAQCDDPDNANKIVEVYQKGYKCKDKVLRASMVKVAQ